MAVLHADLERLIAATGLESTIIRPGMFASNALFWWAPAIRAGDVVRWPYGAAETAPVDERDVAAVAARTLYQDGHAGGDYVLTGPQSLSQAQQVSIIGDVLGRRIRFEELSPEEFRNETAGSWPRPVVDMLLDAWGATMGRPAFVTSTVSDILGSARAQGTVGIPAGPVRPDDRPVGPARQQRPVHIPGRENGIDIPDGGHEGIVRRTLRFAAGPLVVGDVPPPRPQFSDDPPPVPLGGELAIEVEHRDAGAAGVGDGQGRIVSRHHAPPASAARRCTSPPAPACGTATPDTCCSAP